METRGLNELGYKIFLDRYSWKDATHATLGAGDVVLVKVDDNTGQKEIGIVKDIMPAQDRVRVELMNGESDEYPTDYVDKPLELDPAEMWTRTARAMAQNELMFDKWCEAFQWLLEDWKFLPGGRILAAAGTNSELTYYNCYVLPSPHDSKAGIFKTLNDMAQIMARGGGVGINISSLRPKYSYARSTNGRSSGAVSWGELYSYTTGLIEQGGCIAGDSLVATASGNTPIRELAGTKPWVYSFDNDAGRVVLRQASWVGKTGIRKEVHKLTTDKGLTLYATPDHLILCRDGEYRQLRDLKSGMRIMPLLRKWDRWGKDILVQKRLGDRARKDVYESDTPIHRFIYAETRGAELTSDDLIHHIDNNHFNNDPANLELVTASSHAKLHGLASVELGEFVLVDYVRNLTPEERRANAAHANEILRQYIAEGSAHSDWLVERLAHKFTTANPMKTSDGKLKNRKARALSLAYKFINNGIVIDTPEQWDDAIRANLVVKTGARHGLGITTNNDPKAAVLREWYGSYDDFIKVLDSANHRVEYVEFSHYEDVYDMEVPGTNNFAVVMPGDQSTGGIFIHNSRRGALMLILNDWHPDLMEFINVKRDMKRIINANISIGISGAFMDAVRDDADWTFKFPDTAHPAYDEEWDGDLFKWINSGRPVKKYKTMKARAIWDAIIESAWASAEPGLWFEGQANLYSNSHYYAPLICTNPCGEQPLPAWSVCLLGSINLSKFVIQHAGGERAVNWVELERAARTAVRFMDNVIDVTPYIYPEMEAQQKSERRIGLGTMGLAEMLIRLKLRYGSDTALAFTDNLYHFIARAAYDESANLAMEKGTFPRYDAGMMTSMFMQNLLEGDDELRNKIVTHGLRNVTLLTQAPTGTIGTMANTSTGIEPFYFWEYERKGQLGSHIEQVKVYEEWLQAQAPDDDSPMPDYFVTAQDLTPEEHVRMQAAIQRWVDSSISKTCNVPHDYTVEQVGQLYWLMYELGCKGGTVYRDGSRNVQVLNLTTDKAERKQDASEEHAPAKLEWRKRPANLDGRTYRRDTPIGTAYITINHNGTAEPFEVFINVGKAGSDVAADAEGLGRLISALLRMPSTLNVQERVDVIAAQLGGIGSGRAYGFGKNRVMSLADAVAQALMEHTGAGTDLPKMPEYEEPTTMYYNGDGDICPGCGNASLMRVEGCSKCYGCGYSQC